MAATFTLQEQLDGLKRLDDAFAGIKANPSSWYQELWRCSSGMCVAGHVDDRANGVWAYPANHLNADQLVATGDDDPQNVICNEDGLLVISASARARRLLAVDEDTSTRLFSAANKLNDIIEIRNEIARNLGVS